MHAPKVSLRVRYIREPEFQILSALCSIVVIVSAKKNSYPRKNALNKEKSYSITLITLLILKVPNIGLYNKMYLINATQR